MADRVGQQLGQYRLTRLLGKGGFAEVYLGEHARLGTEAAVKVLHGELASEEAESFQQEAQTIATLNHAHIIRLLDYNLYEGTPYLVMTYAPNGALRQRHRKGERLPLEVVLPYVQQVADALYYAHQRHLVHRDIKPENMLLGRPGEVLLSDFGIAVVAQSSRYQNPHEVVGTVSYIAPEQIQAHPRPASDQYALGVVIYEWLTGEKPFVGSMTEVAMKHLMVPPPPLREKLPTISAAVEQVVLTALAKEPKERFASMRAFARAFEHACQEQAFLSAPTQSFSPSMLAGLPPMAGAPSGSLIAPSSAGITPPGASLISSGPIMTLSGPALTPSGLAFTPSGSGSIPSGSSFTPSGRGVTPLLTPVLPELTPPTRAAAGSGPVETPTSIAPEQTLDMTGASTPPTVRAPTGAAAPTKPPTAAKAKKQSRRRSRRAFLLASLGVVGGAAAGGTVAWLKFSQQLLALLPPGFLGLVPATPRAPTPTATPILPGTLLLAFHGHFAQAQSVAWSRDGQRIVSASEDHTAQVWGASDGVVMRIYNGHTDGVESAAWSPDETRIVSGGKDFQALVWDSDTGVTLLAYHGHANIVNSVAWSPDGLFIASGSDDDTAEVWIPSAQNIIFTYVQHYAPVRSLAWSPDSRRVASGGDDHRAQVWDATTGANPLVYNGHSDVVNAVAWSPDGTMIASASDDRTVQVWDALSGKPIQKYTGHTSSVLAVAWSPDGSKIASSSAEPGNAVHVWNVVSGQSLLVYLGHSDTVNGVAWSPDGKFIASASSDRTVQVWYAP